MLRAAVWAAGLPAMAAGALALGAAPAWSAAPASAPAPPVAVAIAIAPGAPPPPAPGASTIRTPLDVYLDHLRTLRASFVQTLVDPDGREIDRATGTLIVERPGKFRWDIHPQSLARGGGARADTGAKGARADSVGKSGDGPTGGGKGGTGADTDREGAAGSGQLMVSDGRNLWFYDRDLEQVTVKPVDAALSATPAMLLSGATDLRQSFTVTTAGERMGLQWVLVEPQAASADFRSALFGFDGRELKRMILEDKLGQTATVLFRKIEVNGPVAADEVSFTPPPGADVIGTPRG